MSTTMRRFNKLSKLSQWPNIQITKFLELANATLNLRWWMSFESVKIQTFWWQKPKKSFVSPSCLVATTTGNPPPPISKTLFRQNVVVMRIADLFPLPLFQIRQRPRGSLCLVFKYITYYYYPSTPPFTHCALMTWEMLTL